MNIGRLVYRRTREPITRSVVTIGRTVRHRSARRTAVRDRFQGPRSVVLWAKFPGRGQSGRRRRPDCFRELPRCPGYVGGDDVSGVPVQAGACAVVAHGGARVGVRCGLLHVAQRDPGVEGGRNERVPQGVRADLLGDPGAPGDPADDPGGAVPVQPSPVASEEQRPFGALAGRQAERPGGARRERDGDDLAALAGDDQGAVPALQAQVLDIGTGGLRYPQPAEDELHHDP